MSLLAFEPAEHQIPTVVGAKVPRVQPESAAVFLCALHRVLESGGAVLDSEELPCLRGHGYGTAPSEQQDSEVTHLVPLVINDGASIYFFPEKGSTYAYEFFVRAAA